MNLFKVFISAFLIMFLAGCGGGKSKSETVNEKVTFEEKQNGDLEILWNKEGDSYRVLAVEKGDSSKQLYKGDNRIKLYEASKPGHIVIVCRPDQLGSSTVTYQCSIKKDGKLLTPVSFVLYSTEGRYDFVMGSGKSFETADFNDIDEKISTAGLDIIVRNGEYKLLDKHRTFNEYHGYFLLLEKNVARGREFGGGTQAIPDYDFTWGYDRNKKEIILDNRAAGGGYAEGKVFGNSDKIQMDGRWSNGLVLDGNLTYLSNSKVFSHNSKKLTSDGIDHDQISGSRFSK